jgi:glucose-6-phosphate isomerase
LIVELDEMNEYTFGEMVYFFEKACGISPGFEEEKDQLEKRLS